MPIELKALGLGILVGAIFSFFKFPIPAPEALTGILGVVGLYLGMVMVRFLVD